MLTLQLLFAAATVLASQASVPERCLQGADVWCQDLDTAIECKREQYCKDLWANLPLWDMLEEAEEEEAARPPSKKCKLCTKLMDQLKSAVGDDPDEDTINSALKSVCKTLGRGLGRVCKSLLKKYRDQISEALQNNEDSTDFCTNIKMCKGSMELSEFWN